MTRQANRVRHDGAHSVGERVWLATKNLPLRLGTRKLAAIWAGPFAVLGQVGPVAYRLDLPSDWKIHNVFHVSQLKSVIGDFERESELLVESGKEFEVERIVDMRISKGQKQFLVKWKDYQDFDNSWVDESALGNAREAISDYFKSLSGKTKTRRGSGVRD